MKRSPVQVTSLSGRPVSENTSNFRNGGGTRFTGGFFAAAAPCAARPTVAATSTSAATPCRPDADMPGSCPLRAAAVNKRELRDHEHRALQPGGRLDDAELCAGLRVDDA